MYKLTFSEIDYFSSHITFNYNILEMILYFLMYNQI